MHKLPRKTSPGGIKRGIFINQVKSQCSIYESGLMVYDAITLPSDPPSPFTIDYVETDTNLGGVDRSIQYDFSLVNWHPHTLAVSQKTLSSLGCKKNIAVVLEVTKDVYLPYTPQFFNLFMIIDPTKPRQGKFYPFPRPLEIGTNLKPLLRQDKTVIGGFGLVCPTGPALPYKRFYELVENANRIGNCIVRLNFPTGTFTGISLQMLHEYADNLKTFAKGDTEVVVTHDYMSKQNLIGWCSQNTVNVFPYYRNLSGLSAVTDQAIASGRPLVITGDNTFRHIHQYIDHYPDHSYEELILSTPSGVKEMQEDWHPSKFKEKFIRMLSETGIL